MGTINDLNTTDSVADEDKFVLWKTQAGSTRAITALDMAAYFSLAGGPYQPEDELLTAIAAQGPNTTNGDFIQLTGQDTVRVRKLTVATYAALTNISASFRFDDMLVYVASRATDGDGGDGWFRFDAASSATANGGTILAPDAGTGRWIRQYSGEVKAKWFPITGNGVADDTAALQAALTAAEGRVLLIPAPSVAWGITDSLTTPAGGVHFKGDGTGILLKVLNPASFAGSMIEGANADNTVIEDLTLDMDSAVSGEHGIHLSASSDRTRVLGCRILNAKLDGVRIASGTNAWVKDCIIEGAGQHGITFTTSVSDFVASGNIVINPGGAGIIFSVGVNGVVSDNIVIEPGISGDGITGYAQNNNNITIGNNVIVDSANHGIHVGGSNIVVDGNVVENSGNAGIFVRATDTGSSGGTVVTGYRNIVSNNVIEGALYANVWIEACEDSKVSGNTCTGAPTNHSILGVLCTRLSVENNSGNNSATGGVVFRGCVDSSVIGNRMTVTSNGVRLEQSGSTQSTANEVLGNIVRGGTTSYAEANTANNNIFIGNVAKGFATQPFARTGAATVWEDGNPKHIQSIASASALALPSFGESFEITGSTTITSISGGQWLGRQILLLFKGTITLSGTLNNLKLNGGSNFNAVSGNTMRLIYDGTNWVEAGRGTGAS